MSEIWYGVISLIVVALGILPFTVASPDDTAAKVFQEWQSWYGVLVAFVGLLIVTVVQFSLTRMEARRIREDDARVFARALAWEVRQIRGQLEVSRHMICGHDTLAESPGETPDGDPLSGVTLGYLRDKLNFSEPAIFSRCAERIGILGKEKSERVMEFYAALEGTRTANKHFLVGRDTLPFTKIGVDSVLRNLDSVLKSADDCLAELEK